MITHRVQPSGPAPQLGPVAATLQAFARCFSPYGRASRSAFAWPLLVFVLFVGGLEFVNAAFVPGGTSFAYIRFATILMAIPLVTLCVRRLHDIGLSGWWCLPGLLPVIGAALTLFLLFKGPQAGSNVYDHSDETPLTKIMLGAGFGGLIWLGLAFQTFWIPAGSMKPTLLIGDYLVVSTTAYGVPCFGLCGAGDRMVQRLPVRGDVVVFKHPVSGADFIKRVVGLPGETVALIDGVVHINGAALAQRALGDFSEPMIAQGPNKSAPMCREVTSLGGTCHKSLLEETSEHGRAYSVLDFAQVSVDTTPVFEVPDGMIFVLGDNRDNSFDSRFSQVVGGVGFVPLENLVGRATRVVFSNGGFALWDPTGFRGARIWTKIR